MTAHSDNEHMKGFIDAMLRLSPPVFGTEEYIQGFRDGTRQRLFDVQQKLEEIRHDQSQIQSRNTRL